MAEMHDKRTPRDILRLIFRRRQMFVLGAVLFTIVTLLASPQVKRQYQATVRFQRRSDQASAADAATQAEDVRIRLDHELLGRGAVRQVMEEVGLTRGLARMDGELTSDARREQDSIYRELRANLSLSRPVESRNLDLFTLTFVHRDPKLTCEIPNALLRNYTGRLYDRIKRELAVRKEFLDKQVGQASLRRDQCNVERIKFLAKHSDSMVDNPSLLPGRIQETESELEGLRLQKDILRQKLSGLLALRKQSSDAAASSQPVARVTRMVPNPEYRDLEQQHKAITETLRQARLSYKPAHPKFKELNALLRSLNKEIAKTPQVITKEQADLLPQGGENDALNQFSLTLQIAQMQAGQTTIDSGIKRLEARLASLEDLAKNFPTIRRDFVRAEENLREATMELKKWQDELATVQQNLAAEAAKRRTHLDTLELAEPGARPAFPTLWMVLGFAVFGGCGFGGVLVLTFTALDRSIGITEDAAKNFDVPIHGVIGEITTRKQRTWRWLVRWFAWPTFSTISLVAIGICILGIVLWLHYPEQYKDFSDRRIGYVSEKVSEFGQDILSSLRGE